MGREKAEMTSKEVVDDDGGGSRLVQYCTIMGSNDLM
jgi:hypothetical protein